MVLLPTIPGHVVACLKGPEGLHGIEFVACVICRIENTFMLTSQELASSRAGAKAYGEAAKARGPEASKQRFPMGLY